MTELKNSKIFIYTFVIFFSFFIRFYLFEDRNSWHDEWHSIYVSDPNVSFKQTIERYLGNKGDSFLTEFYLISKKFFLKKNGKLKKEFLFVVYQDLELQFY